MCPVTGTAAVVGGTVAASAAAASATAVGAASAVAIGTAASATAAAAATSATFLGLTSFQLASLAVGLIGAGISGVGMLQQGQAAQKQAAYQAAIEKNNAVIAEQKATRSRLIGEQDRVARLLLTGQQTGQIDVALAANGVEVGTGTAFALKQDAKIAGLEDSRMIAHNAEVTALSFEAEAGSRNAQASLTLLAGQSQQRASTTGAFSTLLSGAGSVANKWYGFNRQNQGFA
tara:strand:+ start:495 stop:1190 length:696 start_codon:yes stop_codon:yes gene_type:complete